MAVKHLLAGLRGKIVVPKISDNDAELNKLWVQLQAHPNASGTWVGHFERVVLFGAVLVGSWEAVSVWLAFKLAAKWEAWNYMGYVP